MDQFQFELVVHKTKIPLPKKVFFNDEVLLKDILSLTLNVGWENEKWPSGPIELDFEAGNLVIFHKMLS